MRYEFEDLRHCVGMMCRYKQYRVNGDWLYSGIIKEVQPAPPFNYLVSIMENGTYPIKIIKSHEIIEIPMYDRVKQTPLFKLITYGK